MSNKKMNKTTKQNNKQQPRVRRRATTPMNVIAAVPTRFPRAMGDVIATKFSSVSLIAAGAGSTYIGAVVLGNGPGSAGITYLSQAITGFGALCNAYSRYLVTDLTVEAHVTCATTAGGYIAANFEPQMTDTSGIPSGLIDVSNSNVLLEATHGSPGKYTVRPIDYYADWRYTTAEASPSDRSVGQMGLVQVYASGPANSTVGTLRVTCTVLFAGYKG